VGEKRDAADGGKPMSNLKAPKRGSGQGKIHEVIHGRTRCGTKIYPEWEATDEPADCPRCLGISAGWKRTRSFVPGGHYGVVGYGSIR